MAGLYLNYIFSVIDPLPWTKFKNEQVNWRKKIINNSDLVFPAPRARKGDRNPRGSLPPQFCPSVCPSVPSRDYCCLGTMRFLSMSKELPSGCTVTTSPSSWWTRRNPESSRPAIHTCGPSALPRRTCWALKRKNSPRSLGHVRGSGGLRWLVKSVIAKDSGLAGERRLGWIQLKCIWVWALPFTGPAWTVSVTTRI